MTDKAGTPVADPTNRVVVYSCYFGQHEPLNVESMGAGGAYDRVIFTDQHDLSYPGAKVVHLDDYGLGPALISRKPKIQPHLFFAEYDWVMYVDNRAQLKCDPNGIVSDIDEQHKGNAPAGRYLFEHPNRDCAWRELRVCFEKKMVSKEQLEHLRALFREQGFPRRQGLFVNTMMVQKMGCEHTDKLNNAWWDLFLTHCPRDQVTLGYVVWRLGIETHRMHISPDDLMDWPVYSFRDRRQFQRQLRASDG